MTPKTPTLDTWWSALERLSRALGQVGPDEVCCAGLTVRQCAILRTLVTSEGSRLLDLAQAAGITQSAMTRVVEKLEARGLVRRVRGTQEDGRAAMVAITPEGRQVREQIDQLMLDRTRAILRHISASERAGVLHTLNVLNSALEQLGCCAFNAPATCGQPDSGNPRSQISSRTIRTIKPISLPDRGSRSR